MNIALFILRLIGIILLCVLGLILLLFLTVMFVPLCYKGQGVVHGREKPEGRISVRWLLGLVHVRAGYAEGASYFEVLLFGHKIGSGKKKKEKTGKNKKKKNKSNKNNKNKKEEPLQIEEKTDRPAKDKTAEEKPKEEKPEEKKPAAAALSEKTEKPSEKKEDKRKPEKRKKKSDGPSPAEKVSRFLGEIPEKICDLIEKFFSLIEHGEESLERLAEKIASIEKRVGPLIDTESKAFYTRSWRRIRRMLRHFKIRRISGYLDFGTGSPDQTGMITGLVYMLLPAGADRLTVTPDMHESRLDTDFSFKGHIRLWHTLIAAAAILLDKDFRRTLRLIRKYRGGK